MRRNFDKFEEKGYDDIEQLISIASDESELSSFLKDVGLESKPGHTKRFVAAIKSLTSKLEHGCFHSKESKQDNQNLDTDGSVKEISKEFSKCEYTNIY